MATKAKDWDRLLRGRTIVGVTANPWTIATSGEPATNPVITLDDGTAIRFHVQETEDGDYGVSLLITKGRKKARPVPLGTECLDCGKAPCECPEVP